MKHNRIRSARLLTTKIKPVAKLSVAPSKKADYRDVAEKEDQRLGWKSIIRDTRVYKT